MQIIAVGVRSLGMGGAQIAAANDAAAVWNNPACLRAVTDNQVFFALGGLGKQYDILDHPPLTDNQAGDVLGTVKGYAPDDDAWSGGQLAAVQSLDTLKFAWGVSVHDPFEEDFYDGRQEFNTIYLGLGFALTPLDPLNIGMSVNFGNFGTYYTGGVTWRLPDLFGPVTVTTGLVGRAWGPTRRPRLINDQPGTAGGGVAATWAGFTLAGDIERYFFDGVTATDEDQPSSPGGGSIDPVQYDLSAAGDITEYRLGAEKRLENGPAFLAVRGGWAWKTLLQVNQNDDSPISNGEWTLGVSAGGDRFAVHTAFSWFNYERWRISDIGGYYKERVRTSQVRVGFSVF
ncbi:hypothetical protein KQI52_07595 [bacterium]|nr:hypothetical protein [bacterium]